MEIDLELPSCEQEKFEGKSNVNDDIMDSMVEDRDATCTGTSVAVEESLGRSASKPVSSSGNHEEATMAGANVANCEPQNGLEFETKEAAYSFYREYARSVGFGITIKASRRSKKSGKFIDVKIACSRFGNKRESSMTISNPRSCPKTGCKAGMHMKRKQDEKWVIHSFVKEHNHEICPDDFYCAIRGRNKQSDEVSCPKKGLQLVLDDEDLQLMLEHFMYMENENPNFFYAIDLDHEKRLRNVFWVDAKGRHDYRSFSDVVLFDTFYVRNKYKIPFVPIVGVNNHFQYILLGCALIGDETVSTFVWLMRSWLKAVVCQAPKVIFTDQDNFLNEAIADVFPDTRHCFCLWHVLNKVHQELGGVSNKHENFMAKFNKCIYRSWTDEQFDKRWFKMVDRFEIMENKWVKSLYEDRQKWVPTYVQKTFLAGMSTNERSESVASFFDKYISKEASFKEFIESYGAFCQDRYKMEAEAECETQNKQPGLRPFSSFEKQMSIIYTDTIFKKFQAEVLGLVSCHLQKERKDGTTIVFRVYDFEDRRNFYVTWSEAEVDVCCLCRLFGYRGFLCKHAIFVLQMSGYSEIPSHYILKRWTKDAKISQAVSDMPSKLHYRVQRFHDLCRRAIKLGEEGCLSQEAYVIAFQAVEEALKHCVGVNNCYRGVLEAKTATTKGFLDTEEDNHGNDMAKPSKKRKMSKKRKVCSELQTTINGLQDSCQQMEQMNSRAHTLSNCYVPQQDMQETEAGTRAPTLEGYYDSQPSIHGVGQLDSISPIRDGYYSNHQSMQGLGQLHSLPSRIGPYGNQQNQSIQGMLQQGQLGFRVPTMHGCFDIQDSLQDMEDQPGGSDQFHGITSKHLHDKHLSR